MTHLSRSGRIFGPPVPALKSCHGASTPSSDAGGRTTAGRPNAQSMLVSRSVLLRWNADQAESSTGTRLGDHHGDHHR